MLAGSSSTPQPTRMRHSGQRSSWREHTMLSRQRRQKVCWHGNTLAVVSRRSRHTEHSSKSSSDDSSISSSVLAWAPLCCSPCLSSPSPRAAVAAALDAHSQDAPSSMGEAPARAQRAAPKSSSQSPARRGERAFAPARAAAVNRQGSVPACRSLTAGGAGLHGLQSDTPSLPARQAPEFRSPEATPASRAESTLLRARPAAAGYTCAAAPRSPAAGSAGRGRPVPGEPGARRARSPAPQASRTAPLGASMRPRAARAPPPCSTSPAGPRPWVAGTGAGGGGARRSQSLQGVSGCWEADTSLALELLPFRPPPGLRRTSLAQAWPCPLRTPDSGSSASFRKGRFFSTPPQRKV